MASQHRKALGQKSGPGDARPQGWPASAAVGLFVLAAGCLLLYLRVWLPGLGTHFRHARHYLASAIRLPSAGRLELLELRLEPARMVSDPLAFFPPLTSWALAALIAGGSTAERAPTLLALAAWPLLLVSIALLTYRLCRDAVLALLAMAIAAVTWPYLNAYTQVSSEILFLPLIVLATTAFTGLSDRESGVLPRLALASVLTTLVVLTRYAGVGFYLAVLIWWIWHRARRRRFRRLVPELAILAVPGLALLSCSARNVALTGHVLGPVLTGESGIVGYAYVAKTFLTQGTWLVLPAVRPGPVWRAYGLPGAAVVLAIVIVGVWLLWRALRRGGHRRLPSSPVLSFLLLYLLFLAAAPSFMRMHGIVERYMAVVLALAHPYLIALLAGGPRRWARSFLVAFLAVNLGLAVFAGARQSLGFWIETGPLRTTDLAGDPDEQLSHLLARAPAWWVHRPPRLHDLDRHLPEMARSVNGLDPRTAIVSNAPELFSSLERHLLPLADAVATWLEHGGCEPPFPVAIVVVDWDRWASAGELARNELPADRLRTLVEARCPAAQPLEAPRGTVYLLPSVQRTESRDP